jgi:hypothetical protein
MTGSKVVYLDDFFVGNNLWYMKQVNLKTTGVSKALLSEFQCVKEPGRGKSESS